MDTEEGEAQRREQAEAVTSSWAVNQPMCRIYFSGI